MRNRNQLLLNEAEAIDISDCIIPSERDSIPEEIFLTDYSDEECPDLESMTPHFQPYVMNPEILMRSQGQPGEHGDIIFNGNKDENLLDLPLYEGFENIQISGREHDHIVKRQEADFRIMKKFHNGFVYWTRVLNQHTERYDCGTFRGFYADKDHNTLASFTHCYRQGCPDCFRSWAGMAADKMYAILKRQIDQIAIYTTKSWFDLPLYHITVSLDPTKVDMSLKARKQNKLVIAKLIKQYHAGDFPVATIIEHPFRLKKKCSNTECNHIVSHEAKYCDNPDCYNSKGGVIYLRNNGLPNFIPLFIEVHWEQGLHYHLISNLYIDKPNFEFLKQDLAKLGFTLVNITQKKKYNAREEEKEKEKGFLDVHLDEQALKSIMAYELGHATLDIDDTNKHAITYLLYAQSRYWDNTGMISVQKEVINPLSGSPYYRTNVLSVNQDSGPTIIETDWRKLKCIDSLGIHRFVTMTRQDYYTQATLKIINGRAIRLGEWNGYRPVSWSIIDTCLEPLGCIYDNFQHDLKEELTFEDYAAFKRQLHIELLKTYM